MPRSTAEIIADIERFEPADGEWLPLDDLLGELFETRGAQDAIPVLVRVFERYLDDDGAGVFWSIVHGLEKLPGYEQTVVEAIGRAPTEFTLMMVKRVLNGGIKQVGEVTLLPLLRQIASKGEVPEGIRKKAEHFVQYQQSRGG